MEAAAVFGRRSTAVQETAPAAYNSQIRNCNKIRDPRVPTSWPDQSSLQGVVGVLQAPPPPFQLFHSSYPPLSLQKPPQLQPPLLPLPPAAYPLRRAAARGLSCPSVNHKKMNSNSSFTPKKQKSSGNNTKNTKKLERAVSPKTPLKSIAPPPSSPPSRPNINVTKVLTFHSDNYNYVLGKKSSSLKVVEDRGVISGNIYDLSSPPPSCLPLPTFPLRSSKLSCNTEATRTDTGATHDLRRLLGLP